MTRRGFTELAGGIIAALATCWRGSPPAPAPIPDVDADVVAARARFEEQFFTRPMTPARNVPNCVDPGRQRESTYLHTLIIVDGACVSEQFSAGVRGPFVIQSQAAIGARLGEATAR